MVGIGSVYRLHSTAFGAAVKQAVDEQVAKGVTRPQ